MSDIFLSVSKEFIIANVDLTEILQPPPISISIAAAVVAEAISLAAVGVAPISIAVVNDPIFIMVAAAEAAVAVVPISILVSKRSLLKKLIRVPVAGFRKQENV